MAICRTLKNGMRIVTERMPFLHSVAVGVWIKAGSATETPAQNGISHFIEHMLFKGTATRDARELAAAADNVGGQLNAFTAKECTCFHVQVTREHFRLAMDLLSDMLKNSTLEEENLRKEQGVVCEEIAMVEDTPDDLVHDLAAEVYFRENPLGRNILGTRKNVRSFHAGMIRDYMAGHYTADHMVVSIAGNFEEEEAIALAEEFFGSGIAPGRACGPEKPEPFVPVSGTLRVHKPNEQMNFCLCYPGTSLQEHEMRYAASLFNAVFGGSMSSRLFQEIREKNGLTYSVFSYPSQYTRYGMFSIYAGMAPRQTGRVLELIDSLIEELRR